jgi:hypothetical protein
MVRNLGKKHCGSGPGLFSGAYGTQKFILVWIQIRIPTHRKEIFTDPEKTVYARRNNCSNEKYVRTSVTPVPEKFWCLICQYFLRANLVQYIPHMRLHGGCVDGKNQ